MNLRVAAIVDSIFSNITSLPTDLTVEAEELWQKGGRQQRKEEVEEEGEAQSWGGLEGGDGGCVGVWVTPFVLIS